MRQRRWTASLHTYASVCVLLVIVAGGALGAPLSGVSEAANGSAPTPLLAADRPVDWWFVFKFNTKSFPGCGEDAQRSCPFGGQVQSYAFSQQFVYASSATPTLQKGGGCVGTTT